MAIAGKSKQSIPIPEGVTVTVDDGVVTVNGPNGQLTRNLHHAKVKIQVQGNEVEVYCELPRKKENALIGTYRSHINNMILGVTKGFEYKMKIVYSHFPLKVTVKDQDFVIDNFLGEKYPRTAKIVGDTKIVSKGDEVTLTGSCKEDVGQSAANIERATKIKGYDPRVFQDGIYIVSKGVVPG